MSQWEKLEHARGFIRIRLRLASTQEGGRRRPVLSEYRASWDVGGLHEGELMLNDAPLLLEDVDEIPPGGEAVARILPLFPEYWAHVSPGMTIYAHEGSRRIGTATVLEIVEPTGAE